MNIVSSVKHSFFVVSLAFGLSLWAAVPVTALDIGAVADRLSNEKVVNIDGLTSPYAEIVVLDESKNEELIVVGEVELDGEFGFEFKYGEDNLNSLVIFGVDQVGITSRVKLKPVVGSKFILPPTIVNDGSDKGDKNLAILGYTYPSSEVEIELRREGANVENFKALASSTDGLWKLNKSNLKYGKYVGKARSKSKDLVSEWSQEIYFEIPLVETPSIVDKLWFSTLLSAFPTFFLIFSSILLLVALSEWSGLLLLFRMIRGLMWLFGFKRKDKTGIVYDTYTKKPVEGALVSVWTDKGKRIHFDITGDSGEFYIPSLPQGKYRVTCVRNDYKFPSELIRGKGRDGLYVNLYHGEEFELTEKEKIVISIPIDRIDGNKISLLRQFLRKYGHYVAWTWFGVCMTVSVLNFIYEPGFVTGLLLVYYLCVLAYLFFDVTKFYGYSVIYDNDGEALYETTVYIHKMPSLELIAVRVSDEKGKFSVWLSEGKYRISFDPGTEINWKRSGLSGPVVDVKEGYLKLKIYLF